MQRWHRPETADNLGGNQALVSDEKFDTGDRKPGNIVLRNLSRSPTPKSRTALGLSHRRVWTAAESKSVV